MDPGQALDDQGERAPHWVVGEEMYIPIYLTKNVELRDLAFDSSYLLAAIQDRNASMRSTEASLSHLLSFRILCAASSHSDMLKMHVHLTAPCVVFHAAPCAAPTIHASVALHDLHRSASTHVRSG
eukprot:gnl/Trimastix_PCT/178.p2 GENE.gnl/Trimastix_PCT/178~~gnl/Trimastix_PCT/178.p2  ORF type:complete len:126 (+),score=16.26 gnl/Trimastix_PCT/178:151-528(+)